MPDATEVVDSAAVTEEQEVSTPAETTETAQPSWEERTKAAFTDGDEETPATDADVQTEEQKTETDAADTAGQAKPTPGTVNPAAPLVPDAYRRSLKAYQWTDEEIDAAAKAGPAQFLATAAKIHASRIEQTKQWSDLGRRMKDEAAAKPAAEQAKLPELKRVDTAALRKQYGDEPFIAALEQFNQIHDYLEQVKPWIEQSQKRQQSAELETLGRQIDDYFTGKTMEPYHDMYGKGGTKLTDQQLTARQKVLETADLLLGGAKQMGRSMTLDEALTLAHDSVSGPVQASAAVKKVVAAVKTRSNAISMRPGIRSTPAPKGDRAALQAKVKTGLAAAFGS